MKFIYPALALSALLLNSLSAQAFNRCTVSNMWVNGSFENTTTGNACNDLNPVNNYPTTTPPWNGSTTFIGTAGQAVQPQFLNEPTQDHSTGQLGGHFFYVDPRAASGSTYQVKQRIRVAAQTDYTFSAWFASMLSTSQASMPATVQLYINGVAVSSTLTLSGTTANNWIQLQATWNSGNDTIAEASIVAINPTVGGNDFAIDDISFGSGYMDVNAGADANVSLNQNHNLGGAPTAIYGATCNNQYTYSWAPTTGIVGASNIANPIVNINTSGLHVYTVTVTDKDNNTCKDTVQLDSRPTQSIHSTNAAAAGFSVSPNPFQNEIRITGAASFAEQVTVTLVSVTGQKIATASSNIHGEIVLPLNGNLSAGHYFLVARGKYGEIIFTDNVMKQ